MNEIEEPSQCRNCGAAVNYHYCSVCGQETRLHVPSAGEFLHEFIGHYVAFEGKLWQTVWKLLTRPGQLTADYLAGRRARYVQPLRLYLTFSLIFFAAVRLSGAQMANWDVDNVDKRPVPANTKLVQTTPDETRSLGHWLGSINPAWGAKAEHFTQLSGAEMSKVATDGFFQYGPYALFCLLPLFAGYLKLLYAGSGRRYGEHLLFALHTNSFAYLMMLVMLTPDWGPIKAITSIWLVLYLPLAMRRVYGGSWLATVLRWGVLMLLHISSIALAILAAFALAVVR